MAKKKKKNGYNILLRIMLFISILIIITLLCLNILPDKYLIFSIVLLIIITFLFKILFSIRKVRRIASIFSVIIIFFLSIILVYIIKSSNFLETLTNNNFTKTEYSIITLTNSNYKNEKDIYNQEVGIVNKTLDKVKQNIKSYNFKFLNNYSNNENLIDDLLNKKVKIIIIENSYIDIYKEEHENFNDSIKVLSTFYVDKKIEVKANKINVIKEPFILYISGIDTYSDISSTSRSDVNIIMIINEKTHNILLVNIPRDYYIKLHNIGTTKDKLTHAGIYGINTSINSIEDLLDINVNYYIKVNFNFLIELVDLLNGIEVESAYTFNTDNYSYKVGKNVMNGDMTLDFVRARKMLSEGDIARGKNQQAVISALINKAKDKKIVLKYSQILNILSDKFQTNLSKNDISKLLKNELSSNEEWNINSITLSGHDSYEYTHSYSKQKLYVMIPDNNSVMSAKEEILKILNNN